ncbi:hormogonium polysaccharide secretion pseudopilin HpsB [Spirulina major CS-329]|uniref:hormogonium polysaccharide secretion pseudopilin HpsB n=1 Tax=Spirulina TaxID=1154 RepID=UPI0023300AF0|nr:MULTISPECIES: hormogonium polysaccharide secretion pseudopilin HpsB [Spirulina]MDB9496614.1 hormogonium polysaccharide secretion pseudopilin HpsB [Spirulina subsalsa CS-330]MDB9502151.1 hormogonium polysaccharide secretion pseudopilin HpsB [Spirulina major CS-329]
MFTQPTPPKKHTTESGFTIVESLLAVIVIAIVLVGIGPIIAFSAATRLQSRRIEIGIQSARGYLSGVQSGTIADPPITETGAGDTVALKLTDVAAPTGNALTCTNNTYCTAPAPTNEASLYCIDQDNDGFCTNTSSSDLIIQAFGKQAPLGSTTTPTADQRAEAGYQLGIRVYRANGFQSDVTLKRSSDNTSTTGPRNQASIVTGGLGSRSLPVVEMTTEMGIDGSGGTRYEDFCKRINRTASGSCN